MSDTMQSLDQLSSLKPAAPEAHIETSEDECPSLVTLRQRRSKAVQWISTPYAFGQQREHGTAPTQIRGNERGCLLRVIAGQD